MLFLGVDTSNYATSLAVYGDGGFLLNIRRDLPVKAGELGLRQNDAVFLHNRALGEMALQLGNTALKQSCAAVCVSASPTTAEGSYMPCFLAGQAFAGGIAAALDVPLYRTSHQLGHIAAAAYSCGKSSFLCGGKFLAFHVSGGTTDLLLTDFTSETPSVTLIARSLDLHAGQCVDRVGAMLGLPFPAGAQLSALAESCGEKIIVRPSLKGGDCCLSGLENKVKNLLDGGAAREYAAKYCLVYIAETLRRMLAVSRETFFLPCIMAGGVSSSVILRSCFADSAKDVFFADPRFSCDNAAGTALIGCLRHTGKICSL